MELFTALKNQDRCRRDDAHLPKDCCRLKDQAWFLHRLNHSMLEKKTRSSSEAPNPLLMAAEHTTSLQECCGAPSCLSLTLNFTFSKEVHDSRLRCIMLLLLLLLLLLPINQLSACLRRYSNDSAGQGDGVGAVFGEYRLEYHLDDFEFESESIAYSTSTHQVLMSD